MFLAFHFLTGFFGSLVLAAAGATIADMRSPWIFLFFFFSETSPTNILSRHARRLRVITGDDRATSESDLLAEKMSAKDIAIMTLICPITLDFTELIVLAINLYVALFNNAGELLPENWLSHAIIDSFFVPICMFWFGWSGADPDLHWIVRIVGTANFAIASFLLFHSIMPYLNDAVLVGNDLMRSFFGVGFPLFANAMYERVGIAWASSLPGFLGLLFVPVPWVLEKSRNARKDVGR
ncbi:hypothetical protein BS50DRAFT_604968 [Corynespora cassiicola Philippines]|uniref:Uncharacterized protein n=1 Tax=Corynespora cassiicola Philippines TaxID=1448308 RepID=A0A2T2N370_CORCC|nr:hypothetical protein BS50DRAFT_604968 [Corynespora cassiicola Philippines]